MDFTVTPPPVEPGNFKCYAAKALSGTLSTTTVTTADAFQTKVTSLGAPTLVCNNANVNGGGYEDATAHLVCYTARDKRLTPAQTPFAPRTQTMFGKSTVLSTPNLLCVPGGSSALALDSFWFYPAKLATGQKMPKVSPTQIADTFETKIMTPSNPARFGNPADINGQGFVNGGVSLACRGIADRRTKPAQTKWVPQTVTVETQFGQHTVSLTKPSMLCEQS